MKHRVRAVLMLTLSLASTPVFAETRSEFTDLFAMTCMAHFYTPGKLREMMSSPLITEVPPERAAFFLHNEPGTAWEMRYGKGQYVVAIVKDYCAVFAKSAPVDEVTMGFQEMVANAPDPLVASEIAGADAGPNSDDLYSVAYAWSRPEDRIQLVFTLTTARSAQPVQAMASMAYGKKPEKALSGDAPAKAP